jgi:signal transduction histidine kinase
MGRLNDVPLIDDHARRLARAPIADLGNAVGDLLEVVGRRLAADRVSLWELRSVEQRFVLLQQWARRGCALAIETLDAQDFPWLTAQAVAGRTVPFRSYMSLPLHALRERKLLARHGPRSGVMLPIVVGDATAATLVVGTMRRERAWGRSTLVLLERVGILLGAALLRRRAHEQRPGTESRLGGVLAAPAARAPLRRLGGPARARAREEAARLREELVFMGRTAMLAEMGAGIAHELNQPLTAIVSNAETAQRLLRSPRGCDRDEVEEALRDVVNDALRAAEVIARMRDMLRRRNAERVPLDVGALLGGVARRFREEAVSRAIRLSVEVAPGLPEVLGDRVQIEQVAMNLVMNAFEAVGEAKGPLRTVAIRARATGDGDGAGVDVSVRDSGPGLRDEVRARAFDPFYTTKPTGLGMGLAICRSIVEQHGGRLLARNNTEGGATFGFHLPAAPRAAPGARRRKHA